LSIGDAEADVAAVIELPVDHVDVRVKDERLFMELASPIGDLRKKGTGEYEIKRYPLH
jgi:hypothetical protein